MFDRVATDPLALSDDLQAADDRLLTAIARMSPADLAAPSLLTGWTRGHVVTHLARNADALRNLLTWARTGIETPSYPNPQARVDGIEAGAHRPLDEQIEDVRAACARFAVQVAEMPAEGWGRVLDEKTGLAPRVVWRRLREVEVHHVDLGIGYTSADWPHAFTARLLKELVTGRDVASPFTLRSDTGQTWSVGAGTVDITVEGPPHELAAWMSGRSDGAGLKVTPVGPLPFVPDWM